MEHIIAKLLRDFESGQMSRRQLVQSLVLAATAASAVSAFAQTPASAPTPMPTPAPQHRSAFKTVELDHISFGVADYRKTRDFYADLMGMEVTNDNGRNSCQLHFANSILLARNRQQPAADAAPAAAGTPRPTALVDHIAYRIYSWDTDKVREELVRRGLVTATQRPDTGGGPNYSSFHVKDPDGFDLQISGWGGPTDSVNQKKPGD